MLYNGGSVGSLQRIGFREKPTNFGPPLPAEYVTEFSGQTDGPEVRCDLTDTQTHRQTDPTTVTLLRMNAEG